MKLNRHHCSAYLSLPSRIWGRASMWKNDGLHLKKVGTWPQLSSFHHNSYRILDMTYMYTSVFAENLINVYVIAHVGYMWYARYSGVP